MNFDLFKFCVEVGGVGFMALTIYFIMQFIAAVMGAHAQYVRNGGVDTTYPINMAAIRATLSYAIAHLFTIYGAYHV